MHKIRIYLEYTTLPAPRWNWERTQASVSLVPTPGTLGMGAHSPAGEGVGESQFGRLEKKLSTLSILTSWLRGILYSSIIIR
jgi:hypothetical protein